MKGQILVAVFLWCTLYQNVAGQTVTATEAVFDKPQKSNSTLADYGFVGNNSQGAYYVEKSATDVLIKFDKEGQIVHTLKLAANFDPTQKLKRIRVHMLDGRLWAMGHTKVKEGKYAMVAREIDGGSLSYIGPVKKVELELLGKFSKMRSAASIVPTADRKYLLLVDGSKEKGTIHVMDSNFDIVKEGIDFDFGNFPTATENIDRYNLSPGDALYDIGAAAVYYEHHLVVSVLYDGKGNLFINYLQSGVHCYVNAYLKGQKTPVEIDLSEGTHSALTSLALDKDGNVICAGFYTTQGILPRGTLVAKIAAKTGEVIKTALNELRPETLQKLDDQQKSNFINYPSVYYLAHPMIMDASGIYLQVDHHDCYVANAVGSRNSSEAYDDEKGIVLACLDHDGTMKWEQQIPRWIRMQFGSFTSPKSTATVVKDGVCYVVYLDNANNLGNQPENYHYAYPESNKNYVIAHKKQLGALLGTSIDQKGITKTNILITYDTPRVTHPGAVVRLSDKKVMMPNFSCTNSSGHKGAMIGITMLTLH